jgi:adhesin/invasin
MIAWLVAVTLVAATVAVVQQVTGPASSQAAPASGTVANFHWGQSQSTLSGPITVDDESLYYGTSTTARVGTFGVGQQAPSNVGTDISRNSNASTEGTGALWVSTVAIDADPQGTRGEKYAYFWSWDPTNGISDAEWGQNYTQGDFVPLSRVADGQTTAEFTIVPRAGSMESGINYDYWSGGEVIQETGEIFLGSGECAALQRSYRMMIFNPSTGEYNYSGRILPATASDNVFGTGGDTCNGTGYVISDMALDANGNAYIMVQTRQAVPAFGLAAGPHNLLVKVVPDRNNGDWYYNLVTDIKALPTAAQAARNYANSTNSSYMSYGMAFYEGHLYIYQNAGGGALFDINPMSGLIDRVGGATNPAYVQDLASGQTAYVIEGNVYEDTNADGTSEGAAPGQTVALYWKDPAQPDYIFEGTRETDGSGNYSFIVSSVGDYIVRVVQPELNGIPARQTAASATTGANPVTAVCLTGDLTSSGRCAGTLSVPYTDPAAPTDLSQIGVNRDTQPDQMAIYSRVVMEGLENVPRADFMITAAGSYGDASVGRSLISQSGAVHVNGAQPVAWLGDQLGVYSDGAQDNSAHNATDDGVFLASAIGQPVTLQGETLVASRAYNTIQARSTTAPGFTGTTDLKGWVTAPSATGEAAFGTTPTWTPTAASGVWSGSFTPSTATGTVGLSAPAFARFNLSTTAIAVPDNTTGAYASTTAAPWLTEGEIEDYSYTVADAVYRPAAVTVGGTTGGLTVAGATLSTTTNNPVIAPGQAVAAGTMQNLTAVEPAGWFVSAIRVVDSLTGEVKATPTWTKTGATVTFPIRPQVGDDLTVEVTFTRDPDLNLSTLTVSAPAVVGSATGVTATVNVKSPDNQPLPGIVAEFTRNSTDITLSASTCTTDASGQCSIRLTADRAAVYPDELTAEVPTSNGLQEVSGSPATVEFLPGSTISAPDSQLVVNPAGPVTVGTAPENTYTATVTAYDGIGDANQGRGNLVPQAAINFSVSQLVDGNPQPVDPDQTELSATSCITGTSGPELGVCQVTLTSTQAGSFSITAESAAGDDLSGSPAVRNYTAAPPSALYSSLAVNPAQVAAGQTAVATVDLRDSWDNPVLGYTWAQMNVTGPTGMTFADFTAVAGQPGSYTFTVTPPTTTGQYAVMAEPVAGQQLTGNINVVAADPVPGKASFAIDPVSLQVGGTALATLTLLDAYDNPVLGRVPTIQAAGLTATPAAGFGASGDYVWQLTTSNAATYPVTAQLATPAISLSASVTFTPGSVSRVTLSLADEDPATTEPKTATVSVPDAGLVKATFQVLDPDNNPITGLTLDDFIFSDAYASQAASRPFHYLAFKPNSFTEVNGLYTVYLASTTTGQFTVTVTDRASGVESAGDQVTFVSGPPTNQTVRLEIADDTVYLPATTAARLTVTDAFGNGVVVPPASIAITSVPDGVSLAGAIDPELDQYGKHTGGYTMSLQSAQTGRYMVKAAFDLASGSFNGQDQVTFAYDPSQTKVQLSFSPNTYQVTEAADAQVEAVVSVTSAGLPVTGLTADDIDLFWAKDGYASVDVHLVPGSFDDSDQATGVYRFTVYSTVTGVYAGRAQVARLNGTSAPTNLTLTPNQIKQGDLTLSPQTVSLPEDGSVGTSTVSYLLTDIFGNPVPGEAAQITRQWNGPGQLYWTELVDQAGLYLSVVSTVTAGSYHLTMSHPDVVDTAAADVVFSGIRPNKANSTLALDRTQAVTSPGPEKAEVTATVTVRDAANQPIEGLTVNDFAFISDPTGVATAPLTFQALSGSQAGQYEIKLWARFPSLYSVMVQVAGVTLNDSDDVRQVRFVPGTIDPDLSTVTARPGDGSEPVYVGEETWVVELTAFDALGEPIGDLTDVTFNAGAEVEFSEVSEVLPGLYRALATSPKSGTFPLTASSGGVTADDRPNLIFTAGPQLDPTKSNLTVAPTSQTAGAPVKVTITAKDAFDNPIDWYQSNDLAVSGQSVNPTGLPPVAATPGTFNDNDRAQGRYVLDLTSQAAGVFALSGQVQGTNLIQHPEVTFTAGAVCVTNCLVPVPYTRAEMVKNGALADGQDRDQARVWAHDTYGNPVAGAAVVATRSDAALSPETQTVLTGTDGSALVSWTAQETGTFTATVTIDGLSGFPGSVLNEIKFQSGTADPGHSQLSVTPAGPIPAGQSYDATVTVRDASDVSVGDAVVSFAINPIGFTPDQPASLSSTTCTTASEGATSGTCAVTVTATGAGSYQLQARIGTSDVTGSPADLSWSASTICFPTASGEGCSDDPAKQSRVEVTTDQQRADGQAQDIATIYAFDRYGNPVPSQVWTTSTTASELTLVTPSGQTGANGQSQIAYTSLVEGSYQAEVQLAGRTPLGSPIQLSFANVAPGHATLAVTPASQVVNQAITATVTVTNEAGQPSRNQHVSLAVSDPALTTVNGGELGCVIGQDGSCSVDLTTTVAGTYSIRFATPPAPVVAGSPASVVFTAGAVDAVRSETQLVVNGSLPNGQARNIVRVIARDQWGNPVDGVTVASTSSDSHLTIQPAIPTTGATGEAGVTQIWYTADAGGSYLADITVAGLTPQAGLGSPVNLGFGGVVDPGHSEWTIAPKQADQTAPLLVGTGADNTYVATVTARDSLHQPAANAVITFKTEPEGPTWANDQYACQTDNQGSCQVELFSTKSGAFAITAEAASGLIGQAQAIAWQADEVCGVDCTPEPGVPASQYSRVEVTVNQSQADNMSPDIVTLYAFDRYGNPVPNQLVTSSSADDRLRVQAGIPATGDGRNGTTPGVSHIEYYSRTAGVTFEAQVAVGQPGEMKTPRNVPARLSFSYDCIPGVDAGCQPLPGVSQVSHLELTRDNQAADGQASNQVTAVLYDRQGTPVSGLQVRSSSAAAVTVSNPAATDSNGRSVINYRTTVSGQYPAAVEVNSQGVWRPVMVPAGADPTPPANWLSSPATITFWGGTACTTEPESTVPNERRNHIVVTRDNQPADGGYDQATVSLFDCHGNPAPAMTVTSVSDADVTVDPITPTDRASGQTVITYRTTVSGYGSHQATVEFTGADGQSHPVTLTPQAGQPWPAGYSGSPISFRFTTDQVAAPVITRPTPGTATNDPSLVIAGTGIAGATVIVTDQDSGQAVASVTVDQNGNWQVRPDVPLTDGTYVFVAHQDDQGFSSPDSPPVTVTIDTVAPTAPVVTSPADGSAVNSSTPTVNGTGEAGATVSVTDETGQTLCQTTVTADLAWQCVIAPPLAEGDHVLSVVQTDLAGNVSDPTTVRVEVDLVAPTAPTVDTSNPDQVTGTSDPGTNVTVTDDSGQTLCQAEADADGQWSCQPDRPLQPGDEITVTASDPAGNTSAITVRVLAVNVAYVSLVAGQTQTVQGRYFQPGETVVCTDLPGGQVIATTTADDQGQASCNWAVGTLGRHTAQMTGAVSGPGQADFQVSAPMPKTGSPVAWASLAAALALIALAGCCFFVLLRRHRSPSDG